MYCMGIILMIPWRCVCVQVTFLECGGVVLGTGIDHVTMDGMGAFHFIQTWTGVARGLGAAEACSPPSFHDRTLLRALPAVPGLRPPGLLAGAAQRPAPPLRHPRLLRLPEAPRRH